MLDLGPIKERCGKLRYDEGFWTADDCSGIIVWGGKGLGSGRICDIRGWGHLTGRGSLGLDDAVAASVMDARQDFIAHARTDVPALVAEVERLRAEAAEVRAKAFEDAAAMMGEFAALAIRTDDERHAFKVAENALRAKAVR